MKLTDDFVAVIFFSFEMAEHMYDLIKKSVDLKIRKIDPGEEWSDSYLNWPSISALRAVGPEVRF